VRNPESGPTRNLTRSGGPAPSSHQTCAAATSRSAVRPAFGGWGCTPHENPSIWRDSRTVRPSGLDALSIGRAELAAPQEARRVAGCWSTPARNPDGVVDTSRRSAITRKEARRLADRCSRPRRRGPRFGETMRRIAPATEDTVAGRAAPRESRPAEIEASLSAIAPRRHAR
jgi:hypothetical protein